MAIRFSCGLCGKRLAVKDEIAGRRSKCPGCGGEIVVPVPMPSGVEVMAPKGDGPPPIPTIVVGEDWKPHPDPGEPFEIPGLRTALDDDADADGVEPVPVAESVPARPRRIWGVRSTPGRISPVDPWFCNALDCLGSFVSVFGGLSFAISAIGLIGGLVGLMPGISGDMAVSAFMVSVWLLPSGAAIQLIVDVARNIRRLRLHADRNAGIN